MSSMKVFFVLAYLMEALGIDIGLGRMLLTFMLQYVLPPLALLARLPPSPLCSFPRGCITTNPWPFFCSPFDVFKTAQLETI